MAISGERAQFSRRERQIMNIIYSLGGEATVNDVGRNMADPPGRTAVRTMLRILEDKGHLKHKKRGREFIYVPTRSKKVAGKQALRTTVDTFFEGSLQQAVEAYLKDAKTKPTGEDLKGLKQVLNKAKQ